MKYNTLKDCVINRKMGQTDKKPDNFYDVYDSHLSHLRDTDINLLEIGIRWGGSIWGWREYFESGNVVGLDIDPNSLQYNTGDVSTGVKIYCGNQTDYDLLKDINNNHGPFDIIIDDGSHNMNDQIDTFKYLWPLLKQGGIYVVEDVCTSYWPSFDGGYKKENTFIEFTKSLIDNIHSYYHKKHKRAKHCKNEEPTNYLDHSMYSLHIYDSIIIFQKWEHEDIIPIKKVNL